MAFWIILPISLSAVSFIGCWTVYGLALRFHHICSLSNCDVPVLTSANIASVIALIITHVRLLELSVSLLINVGHHDLQKYKKTFEGHGDLHVSTTTDNSSSLTEYSNSCLANDNGSCCTEYNIPTISGSGTNFPENSLFSATINGASFLFVIFSIFHHAHILKKCSVYPLLSKIALVFGCLSGVGAFVAGNCNPAELVFLHNLGAALSFVCICFYMVLLTFLTSRCMLTGLERFLYPIRIMSSCIQVTLTILYCIFFSQKKLYYRHVSAIFEWTLSVNLEFFELSYAVEFYFFSSAMLSVLLSNRDEETSIILS